MEMVAKLLITAAAFSHGLRFSWRRAADTSLKNRLTELEETHDIFTPEYLRWCVVYIREDIGGIYAMLNTTNGLLAGILAWLIADRLI